METMTIEVIAWNASEVWTIEATSYTNHADGTLDVALPDGTIRHFEMGEWMHVRLAGSWEPPNNRPDSQR
jgi:hypothetical protein